MTEDSVSTRLERLRAATEGVRPGPAFEAKVMAAVERDVATDWSRAAVRASRRLLPALAIAAAVGIVYAVESQSVWDDAVSTYGTADGEW